MLATDLIHIVLPPTRREATDKIIEVFQEYTGLQMGGLAAHWTELVFPNDPERMDEPTDLLDYFVLQSIPYIHDSLLQMQAYTEKYPTNRSTAEDAMGFVALYGMTAAAELIYRDHAITADAFDKIARCGLIERFVRLYGASSIVRVVNTGEAFHLTPVPELPADLHDEFGEDVGAVLFLPVSTLQSLYPLPVTTSHEQYPAT